MSIEGALTASLASANRSAAELEEINARCRAQAKDIFRSLTPKQQAMVTDMSPWVSVLAPRRTGKTHAVSAMALIVGLTVPGSITIIMSLTERSVKTLYWSHGVSGVVRLARKYGIKMETNGAELRWELENGSIGYLRNAETLESMEKIRGMEADLYIVDECKSFAPLAMDTLVDDIIDPQRASRQGRIVLIGTPGNLREGSFYRATCDKSRDEDNLPHFIPFGLPDPAGRTLESDLLWSFHQWSLQDNTHLPHQWDAALKKKRSKKWPDDHPTWLLEYMGQWAASTEGLVYDILKAQEAGRTVTWRPVRTKDNLAGLPPEHGPWRLIMGIDIGWHDCTAIVLVAYSNKLKQVREVFEFSQRNLIPSEIAIEIADIIQRYGMPERIVMDSGGVAKSVMEEFRKRYNLPIEQADKMDKVDAIATANGDIMSGQVLVLDDQDFGNHGLSEVSTLLGQMSVLEWDLSSASRELLYKKGRLRENQSQKNDLCDAFLYAYRAASHYFEDTTSPIEDAPEKGSVAWWEKFEADNLKNARKRFPIEQEEFDALPRGPLSDEIISPSRHLAWRMSLKTRNRWKS